MKREDGHKNCFQSFIFSWEHCFKGFEIQILIYCLIMRGQHTIRNPLISPGNWEKFILEAPGVSYSKNGGHPSP